MITQDKQQTWNQNFRARMTTSEVKVPSISPISRNLQYHPTNFWAPVASYDAPNWNSISSNPTEAPAWNSNDFDAPDWNSNDFIAPNWNYISSNPTEFEYLSPSINDDQSSPNILLYVNLFFFLIPFCCCLFALFALFALLLRCNRTLPNIPVVPSTNSNIATVNPTVPQQENESEATLKARRNIVIEILFPYQGNNTKVSIASNTPFNSSSLNF
jgi:hypothetical protein